VFTLQTLPGEPDAPRPEVAESSGFSLHADLAAMASQRDKLERLARYVSREPLHKSRRSRCVSNPLMQGADRRAYVDTHKGGNAVAGDLRRNPSFQSLKSGRPGVRQGRVARRSCTYSTPRSSRLALANTGPSWTTRLVQRLPRLPVATDRLSLTQGGNVRYALKTPYRDGATHVIFEPEDFIVRLAALVPRPRAHLTRYHGVFAPASPDRARIVPRTGAATANECGAAAATDRQRAMGWAQRLRRVFAIDIETCR